MCIMFPYCPMPACFATVVTEQLAQASSKGVNAAAGAAAAAGQWRS
jgi:hypothetical protein